MEREKVPMHMVFGMHDEQHKDGLNIYTNAIESLVRASSNGRVVAFIEDITGTFAESELIRQYTRQGFSPTDAFCTIAFVLENSRRPSSEEMTAYKPNLLSDMHPFLSHQYQLLDGISKKYPDRIYLLPEWETDETHDLALNQEGVPYALQLKREALNLAYRGNFATALPIFQDAVNLVAKVNDVRDKNILDIIRGELVYEDIIGFVSFLGADHSVLSHELRKEGYNVSRTSASKEGQSVSYDPFTVAVRKRRSFPDKAISQNEWIKLLTQMVAYEAVMAMDDYESLPFTEQQISANVRRATKDLTMEDITKFQHKLNNNTVNALVDAIIELLTK